MPIIGHEVSLNFSTVRYYLRIEMDLRDGSDQRVVYAIGNIFELHSVKNVLKVESLGSVWLGSRDFEPMQKKSCNPTWGPAYYGRFLIAQNARTFVTIHLRVKKSWKNVPGKDSNQIGRIPCAIIIKSGEFDF
ncbi:hypothetical protein NPIL_349741 [Nephila pilipes]|uniref:Uncharacterized protein n=1 Tax=Nephila pilipes TaxID=299642 RepID=A0A8X6PNM2_NEPPI|nr:hypothetical protein NPIL_349741 [Nephila pilipes]